VSVRVRWFIDLLAVLASLAGVLVSRRSPRTFTQPASRRLSGEPGFWLAVVVLLVLANQVLVTIYMLRVHQGNPRYIAQYVPSGWFDLADHDSAIRWLAARWPAPRLLSVSVLRAQGLLELPFGLLSYLTVCRWFDQQLYRRLISAPALWSASVTYTTVFILIEWLLHNPYTRDAVIVRVAAGLVVPAVLGWVLRRSDGRRSWRVNSAGGLLVFAASTVSLGVLVLVLYDTVLIYSLGRLATDLPIAVAAAAVLVGARLGARAVPDRIAGPHVDVEITAMRQWFLLFFIPALPVRYALGFGSRWLAVALCVGFAAAASVGALHDVVSRKGIRMAPLVARLSVAVVLSAAGGIAAAAVPERYIEIQLFAGAGVFVVMVTLLASLLDRRATETPSVTETQSITEIQSVTETQRATADLDSELTT
jgi:hypothetical protein